MHQPVRDKVYHANTVSANVIVFINVKYDE